MPVPLPPDRVMEISHDDGRTWRALPRGYVQTGALVYVDGDVAIQAVGRGKTVRYRIRPRVEADPR